MLTTKADCILSQITRWGNSSNVCVLDFMVRRRRFLAAAAAVLMALIALMNLFVCLLKKILADMNRPSVNCRQL
mgnify:CR=1 FL=1